jgi:molybdopterin-guanine dinucleotide biosynthesis protein A
VHRFSNLSGFVLAGGASRRMGRAKAGLVLCGETMFARQVRLLRAVSRSVAVVGLAENVPGADVPVWPDEFPGRGPLGGIYTGLIHARTEFSVFLGCDLPFLEVRFLEFLALRALHGQADVTVPEAHDHRLQPVCAVYRRGTRAVARVKLNADLNKTQDLIRCLHCDVVSWREIAQAGFAPRLLAHMNAPEEYESVKRMMAYEF